MAIPTFVTQATNFTSTLAGGVDPRTGLYTISIHLGQLLGNHGAGPALPLTLRYSPLNRSNVGLGVGWTLGLTTLNLGASPVICVSTGEQYGLAYSSDQRRYIVMQQQLQSFKLLKEDDTHYWVVHKNGEREYIEISGNSGCVKKIVSPAGHILTLDWNNQEPPCLTKVTDADGNLLFDVPNDYQSNGVSFSLMSFSTATDHGEAFSANLEFSAGLVHSITLQARDCDDQAWVFSHDFVDPNHVWGQWITGIKVGPGGYHDVVEYSKTHVLPTGNGAPSAPLPCAGKYTRNPGGGQTTMVTTYTYSANNFMGGNASNIKWYADRDSLMEIPFDEKYLYSSVETQASSVRGGLDVATTRTYNAYHLETQVDVASDGCKHTTKNTYKITSGTHLGSQVAWYQCPISIANTWNDAGEEISYFEWDNWGNRLSQTDPDGLITRWAYYNEAGEEGRCPPEPNLFRRFVKWKLIDCGGVKDRNWIIAGAPVQQQNYQYDYAKSVSGFDKKLVVRVLDQRVTAVSADVHGTLVSPTVLEKSTYQYWPADSGDTDPFNAGRLYNRITTHYSNDGTGKNYDTRDDYVYQYLDKNNADFPFGLKTTHTVTGHKSLDENSDTLSVTDVDVKSACTDRLWQAIDVLSNATSYVYDSFGRLRQRIMDPAEGSENILIYAYGIDNTGVAPFQVTQEDVRHNRVRYTIDGLRRPYRQEVNSVDLHGEPVGDFYPVSSTIYDGIGRLWKTTVSDTAFDQNGQAHPYVVTSTRTYDGWGQTTKLEHSNAECNLGVVENTIHDPIARTVKAWNSSATVDLISGSTLTYYDYNFSQKPYRGERYTVDGVLYSWHSMKYDGLHRVRAKTEEVAADVNAQAPTTAYDYDYWHRINKTTLPDKTIVLRSYSADSAEKRVTNIQITQQPGDLSTLVSPGSREFDAFGRIIKNYLGSSAGKRCWTYGYDKAAQTRPSTASDPNGISRTYKYSEILGEAVRSVKTEGVAPVEQNFDYEFKAGLLISANVINGQQRTYDTYPSGRLRSEQLNGEDGPVMHYSYTVAGAPYSYTHVDGVTQTISRDQSGRISNITDGEITVTPHYDGLNRLTGWSAEDKHQHTVTTALTLDEHGREVERTIRDNVTGDSWDIKASRAANDLLSQVSFLKNNLSIRVECYAYDKRNRLVEWSANPSEAVELPCDQYGNQICKQKFTIDSLNNITEVNTSFANPVGENTAIYNFTDSFDPCRLTGGSNTHPDYPATFCVKYDSAGRILDDGMGTTFTYDELGRVLTASSTLTTLSGAYTYDAHNRLASQSISSESEPIAFHYRANSLVNLIQGTDQARLFRSPIGGAVAQVNVGSNEGSWLYGTNQLGSVLSSGNGSITEARVYSAYGMEKIS